MDFVVEIWEDLKSKYEQGDLLSMMNLQEETSSLTSED